MKHYKGILLFITLFVLCGCNSKNTRSINLNKITNSNYDSLVILDSGISTEYAKEIENNISWTYNAIDESNNVEDNNSHGTSLVSLILGSKKYSIPSISSNTKLGIVKIVDNHNKISDDSIIKGLNYAEKKKASVINLSFGKYSISSKVKSKIESLLNKNITVISAAGDYGNKDLLFPSSIQNVISVGSINSDYGLSKFSNKAQNMTCSFNGEDLTVLSLANNKWKNETSLYGTSYSAIQCSAYIYKIKSLLYEKKINISNSKLYNTIKRLDPRKNKQVIVDKEKILSLYLER